MRNYKLLSVMAVAGLVAAISPDLAFATTGASGAGQDFGKDLVALMSGNWGTLAGLLVAILGLYTWLVKQETWWGIMMLVFGIAVTAFPGLFANMQDGFKSAIQGSSADKQTIITK